MKKIIAATTAVLVIGLIAWLALTCYKSVSDSACPLCAACRTIIRPYGITSSVSVSVVENEYSKFYKIANPNHAHNWKLFGNIEYNIFGNVLSRSCGYRPGICSIPPGILCYFFQHCSAEARVKYEDMLVSISSQENQLASDYIFEYYVKRNDQEPN
jgi:hypothetical protein